MRGKHILSIVALAVLSAFWIAGCAAPTSPGGSTPRRQSGIAGHAGGIEPYAAMPLPAAPKRDHARGIDEIWVIDRSGLAQAPERPAAGRIGPQLYFPQEAGGDDFPGMGTLVTELPDRKRVPLPLKHTDVRADIAGHIATVEVTQQFHNPYDGKIEAIYVFPLPQNAAVNDFIMTIGERRIRGIIREREEAQKIYREARRQGYAASLLAEERPNIFTQSVANIEPGKAIDVNIKYFDALVYADGWYEFVFPMVVGPRFNPPGSGEGVGAVPRGRHGASGQQTEVQYLRPTERSGHDIALKVDLDAGVAIEELKSVNHLIKTRNLSRSNHEVVLSANDAIPNKDFVLRYRVAGATIKSNLLTYRDRRGGFSRSSSILRRTCRR